MSVYKEAFRTMEELGRQQTQIFDDACDYGIPITKENDKPIQLVKQLIDQYFNPEGGDTRTITQFNLGVTITIRMTFIDEWNTGKEIPCTITYTRQPLKRTRFGTLKGILEIDCEWAR
ncbi:unnamed protein product [Wuchereria bancrofti]|uniref:Uncharacterized protein n=1 Tax=Wuchereria bancrofti TaxID=6293 RepID=A0A3P7F8M0_WUCBA|nr:unnamed protein product [Wuchereria bancrofti]